MLEHVCFSSRVSAPHKVRFLRLLSEVDLHYYKPANIAELTTGHSTTNKILCSVIYPGTPLPFPFYSSILPSVPSAS